MPELDDQDPPEFLKYVNTHVTLDMISSEDLVQELVDRGRLFIKTARRTVGKDLYERKGFFEAIYPLLARDLAASLTRQHMAETMETIPRGRLEFASTIVVLGTEEDEYLL